MTTPLPPPMKGTPMTTAIKLRRVLNGRLDASTFVDDAFGGIPPGQPTHEVMSGLESETNPPDLELAGYALDLAEWFASQDVGTAFACRAAIARQALERLAQHLAAGADIMVLVADADLAAEWTASAWNAWDDADV